MIYIYDFLIPKDGEKYDDYIHRILNHRKNNKDENNYQERHHIKPKCLGGTNDDENLIWLYAEEHYYAHKLLALENPHEQKIQYPWWMLSTRNKEKISADEYAKARTNFAKTSSNLNSGKKNGMYGKTIPEEQKRKLSEMCKKRIGDKNPNFGKSLTEEHKKKVSDSLKGKYTGENNHMFGKKLSIETKLKIGESQKGGKNHKARSVICLETGKIYPTLTAAAEDLNISGGGSHIGGCCRGERKTCGGYHWKYYEDYLRNKEM